MQMIFYSSLLQAMFSICEQFTKLRKLKFSTNEDLVKSKTKSRFFSKAKYSRVNVAPFILNGDALPWVDSFKYLGNVVEFSNSMKIDCGTKRGKMTGKVNSFLPEFYFFFSLHVDETHEYLCNILLWQQSLGPLLS